MRYRYTRCTRAAPPLRGSRGTARLGNAQQQLMMTCATVVATTVIS
jgi:hypothetical protein